MIEESEGKMLWIIFSVLLVLWLVGFIADVAGGLIHVLLAVALIVLAARLVMGRGSAIP